MREYCKVKQIQDTDMLSTLADPMSRELAGCGVVRTYRKGVVVINEGDIGDTVYVILKGKVKIFVTDEDQREMILDTRGVGESVGEMSMDGGVRSASVMCVEDCTFSILTRKTLNDAIRANPEFAITMMSILISRARLATDLVKDLAFRDVYQRVARLLPQLAEEQPDGRLIITERISQAEIAKRVGASRDMVNRIFRELTNGGYVKIDGDQIVLSQKKLPLAF
jgi:CRP/FNR family cyclic AMP-dependent transcriptional regulator